VKVGGSCSKVFVVAGFRPVVIPGAYGEARRRQKKNDSGNSKEDAIEVMATVIEPLPKHRRRVAATKSETTGLRKFSLQTAKIHPHSANEHVAVDFRLTIYHGHVYRSGQNAMILARSLAGRCQNVLFSSSTVGDAFVEGFDDGSHDFNGILLPNFPSRSFSCRLRASP